MSKLRRQRKARSRVERIDGRSLRCENELIRCGRCVHGHAVREGHLHRVRAYNDYVVSIDDPPMESLSDVACTRTRNVISHPMTQLYKLVDPQWFGWVLGFLKSPLFRIGRDMKNFARDIRREFLAISTLLVAMRRSIKDMPRVPVDSMSTRRALKLARRFRRKAREANEAKLRDKYGRQRS